MQFDLMYIILPAAALLVGLIFGRISKNVKEETLNNIFHRLRDRNSSLKQKLEATETTLHCEREDRFNEHIDRIKKATRADNLWMNIQTNNSLETKNIWTL